MTTLLLMGVVVVGCAGAFTFAGYVFGDLAADREIDRRARFAASMTEHLQDANADFRKLADMLLQEKRRSQAWMNRALRAEWRLWKKSGAFRPAPPLAAAAWALRTADKRYLYHVARVQLVSAAGHLREIAHKEGRGVP